MIYRQTSTIRKIVELIIIVSVVGLIDQWFALNATEWLFNPFIFIILLFSLRYGLNIGLLTFFITTLYYVADESFNGGDVFLLFYDEGNYIELLFLLVLTIIGGMYGTGAKERYESLHYSYDEVSDENKEMREVVEMMEESQKSMQERMLESEYSLKRIYEVGKSLDQPNADLIRNEAIRIISDLFQAKEVALYHVDSSQHAMRLYVRKGSTETFPQTIFINSDSLMYQRLFTNQTITLRTVQDEEGAPLLAGPVVTKGVVKEVLLIDHMDFARLTSYEIQILSILLDWLSDRLEKAHKVALKEEESLMYPGTRIYYKEAFYDKVEIQKKRSQTYGVPYSIIQLGFDGSGNMSLLEVEVILRAYLREIDRIGFDEENQQILFLLPGTEESKASVVENRIQKYLNEKGVHYVE
ncbi:hypothetical protein LCM20_15715 [Halobacillus litoralis]|uniref:hypothetical protein n=1 Tax=Halobacillus litoralis TaxID=45668 RepID=UPI001CD79B13|nr:hypothetical protein [Halobacillus litoralis]MCA0972054.1 hypothetical protein [Halobacillus litoralis]